MTTLILQVCVSLVRAAFALMALRAARSIRPWARTQRLSWMATGVTFSIYAAIMLVQDFFGVRAYLAGAEAPVYAFYMWLAPIVDHSRTIMMFGLYAALIALGFGDRFSDRAWWRIFTGALVGTTLLGAGAGYVEGSLTGRHFTNTAVLDVVGFAVLGATLLFSMYRDSIDRYLWMAITMYGFSSIAGALYMTTWSWFASGNWRPPAWQRSLVSVIIGILMVVLAHRRWRLARRGVPVQGLMPELRTRPMLG